MNTASYYFFMVPFDFSGGPGPSPEPQPEPEPEPQPEPELLVERGFGMFKSLPEEPGKPSLLYRTSETYGGVCGPAMAD